MKTAWPQGQAIESVARPAGAQEIGYRLKLATASNWLPPQIGDCLKLATASIGVGEFEQQGAARQAHWD